MNVFWQAHDPTTLNRQGNDIGTQYRSVIYYHNDEQKMTAIKSKSEAGKSGHWDDEIVTEISEINNCLLYTSPSPRDGLLSRMPSSA